MSESSSDTMASEAAEARERHSGSSLAALTEQKSKLAEHVGHRPQKGDLIHKNIIKDYTPSVDPKLHGAMRALVQHQTEVDKLSQKLGRRQSWQKLVSQGIMLEQPLKHSPHVVLATQALRKQRDRDKLARFLSTRPSLEQINALSLDDTMTWERYATQGPAPSARNCHTMTAIGTNLYLLGGYGTNARHMELAVLDTSSQRCWTRPLVGGDLPLERYSHTCSKVDGKLVVFGGFSFNGYRLNDLYVLDTDHPAQFFHEGDAMPSSMLMWYQPKVQGTPPCARAAFTATAVDKKIYFFGGNDGQNLFNDLFMLDTETWTWTECHTTGEVPTPRAGHTANLVNPNTIVVFGGGDVDGPSNHLYIFDVDTLEWTQPKIYGTPPSVRMGHTATTVNTNQFIVFGGNYMDKVFNDLHMFDIETLQWSRPSDTGAVPLPRAGHSACSIGCQVFFFGGGDSDDLFSDLHVLDTSYLKQDRSKQDSNAERQSAPSSPRESDWAEEEQEAQAFKMKLEASTAHVRETLKTAREQVSKAQIELSAKTRGVAAALFALEQSTSLNFEQLNQYVAKVEAAVGKELEEVRHGFEHYRSIAGFSKRLPVAPPAPTVEPGGFPNQTEVRTRSPSDDVARQVKVALRRPPVRYEELKKVPEGDESPFAKRGTPPVTTPSTPLSSSQTPVQLASPSISSTASTPSDLITPTLLFPSPSCSAASAPSTVFTTASTITTTATSTDSATKYLPNSPTIRPTPATTSPSTTGASPGVSTVTTAKTSPASSTSSNLTPTPTTTALPLTPNLSTVPSTISQPVSSTSTTSASTCSSTTTSRSWSASSTPENRSAVGSPVLAPSTNVPGSVLPRSPFPVPKTPAAPTVCSPPSATFRNSGTIPSITVSKSSSSFRTDATRGGSSDVPSSGSSSGNSSSGHSNSSCSSGSNNSSSSSCSSCSNSSSSSSNSSNSSSGTSSSSSGTSDSVSLNVSNTIHTPKGSPVRSGSGSSSPSFKGQKSKVSNWGKAATTTTSTKSSAGTSSGKTDTTGRSRSCSKGDASTSSGRRGSCTSPIPSAASTRLLWKQKEQETQQLKYQRNRPAAVTVQQTTNTKASEQPSTQPPGDIRLPLYAGIDPQLYADPLDKLGPQGLLEGFQRLQREEEEYVDVDGSSRVSMGVAPLTPEQILHLQQKQAHLASLLDRHGYSQSFNRPTILSALISNSSGPATSAQSSVVHHSHSGGPPPPPPRTK